MPHQCSICSTGAQAALTVNELVARKTPLRDIEAQTGFGRSSISRHTHGDCEFSFSKFKTAKVRARKGDAANSGRLFVQWSDEPTPTGIGPNDDLLVVEYVVTNVADIIAHGNPRALPPTAENLEAFWTDALVEDAEHSESLKLTSE